LTGIECKIVVLQNESGLKAVEFGDLFKSETMSFLYQGKKKPQSTLSKKEKK
jgi:hypothetical protein